MLIQPDIDELGDKRLNHEEGLAAIKQDTRSIVAKSRVSGQDELADIELATGNALDWRELLRRCKLAARSRGKHLIVTDGGPGGCNPQTIALGIEQQGKYQYVAGFHKSLVPEFTSVVEDQYGAIIDVSHGWREVVLRLLNAHVISWPTVTKVFGDATSQRSGRWQQQTQNLR
jgi:hypothetical protein